MVFENTSAIFALRVHCGETPAIRLFLDRKLDLEVRLILLHLCSVPLPVPSNDDADLIIPQAPFKLDQFRFRIRSSRVSFELYFRSFVI